MENCWLKPGNNRRSRCLRDRPRIANQKLKVLPAGLTDPDQEALRLVLYAPDAPANLPVDDIPRLFDVPTIQKVRALKRKLEELDATHRGAPPRAMALQDNSTPTNPHVFLRGNPGNRGPEVPRQFLAILAGENRKPFQKGSGRLELAQAIASPENPLTARVFVNRVWLQHFGSAIVRTPSDFGVRSESPSHLELLDYLASRFMASGWSIKSLHRLIMLSSVYQQASDDNPAVRSNRSEQSIALENESAPPRIRGHARYAFGGFRANRSHRRRTAGRHHNQPFVQRRTIYGFVERQNLPVYFARSTSPARTRPAHNAFSRQCRNRLCS